MVQITKTLRQLLLAATVIASSLTAAADVTFKFAANTINEGPLKSKMESSISKLLTEINRAEAAGTDLNLSGIDMEPTAKTRLTALWGDTRFVCDKTTNVSKCLNDFQGYQVRNIHITMKPVDSSYDSSLNRELTVSLNSNGVITGVRPAWELQEDVSMILNSAAGVTDIRQRREILKWVEDFRCYYNERNINALNQIYSDDAIIITGSVMTQRKVTRDDAHLDNTIKYTVQTKAQYIEKLKKIFKNTSRINVKFDHISVMAHNAKPNIYGVTLHQTWQTSGYSDKGWLFLLWDFNDPEKPQIHVRTWQPDQIASQDEVFTLDDFFIP